MSNVALLLLQHGVTSEAKSDTLEMYNLLTFVVIQLEKDNFFWNAWLRNAVSIAGQNCALESSCTLWMVLLIIPSTLVQSLSVFNILFLAVRRSVLNSSSCSLKYKSIKHRQLKEDYFLFVSKDSREMPGRPIYFFSEIVTNVVVQGLSRVLSRKQVSEILKWTA
jgi:hypothetical protein